MIASIRFRTLLVCIPRHVLCPYQILTISPHELLQPPHLRMHLFCIQSLWRLLWINWSNNSVLLSFLLLQCQTLVPSLESQKSTWFKAMFSIIVALTNTFLLNHSNWTSELSTFPQMKAKEPLKLSPASKVSINLQILRPSTTCSQIWSWKNPYLKK